MSSKIKIQTTFDRFVVDPLNYARSVKKKYDFLKSHTVLFQIFKASCFVGCCLFNVLTVGVFYLIFKNRITSPPNVSEKIKTIVNEVDPQLDEKTSGQTKNEPKRISGAPVSLPSIEKENISPAELFNGTSTAQQPAKSIEDQSFREKFLSEEDCIIEEKSVFIPENKKNNSAIENNIENKKDKIELENEVGFNKFIKDEDVFLYKEDNSDDDEEDEGDESRHSMAAKKKRQKTVLELFVRKDLAEKNPQLITSYLANLIKHQIDDFRVRFVDADGALLKGEGPGLRSEFMDIYLPHLKKMIFEEGVSIPNITKENEKLVILFSNLIKFRLIDGNTSKLGLPINFYNVLYEALKLFLSKKDELRILNEIKCVVSGEIKNSDPKQVATIIRRERMKILLSSFDGISSDDFQELKNYVKILGINIKVEDNWPKNKSNKKISIEKLKFSEKNYNHLKQIIIKNVNDLFKLDWPEDSKKLKEILNKSDFQAGFILKMAKILSDFFSEKKLQCLHSGSDLMTKIQGSDLELKRDVLIEFLHIKEKSERSLGVKKFFDRWFKEAKIEKIHDFLDALQISRNNLQKIDVSFHESFWDKDLSNNEGFFFASCHKSVELFSNNIWPEMGGNILASRDFCAYLEIDFKESLGGKEIITQKDLDAFIKLIKSRFDRFLEKFKDDPLQLRRILWFKKKFSDFCEKEIIEKVKKSQQVSVSEFGYEKIYTLTSLDDEEKFQYFKFALENSINAGKMVLYNAK